MYARYGGPYINACDLADSYYTQIIYSKVSAARQLPQIGI
jgi:hypothetical protein